MVVPEGKSFDCIYTSWPKAKQVFLIVTVSHPGRVIWKPINAKPGLKVYLSIYFWYESVFHCIFQTQKKENQCEKKNPHRNVTKLRLQFSLILSSWVSLMGLRTTQLDISSHVDSWCVHFRATFLAVCFVILFAVVFLPPQQDQGRRVRAVQQGEHQLRHWHLQRHQNRSSLNWQTRL